MTVNLKTNIFQFHNGFLLSKSKMISIFGKKNNFPGLYCFVLLESVAKGSVFLRPSWVIVLSRSRHGLLLTFAPVAAIFFRGAAVSISCRMHFLGPTLVLFCNAKNET